MILVGSGGQHRSDADTDDVVAHPGEVATHPARAARGVEHTDAARRHRADESGLAGEIVPGSSH